MNIEESSFTVDELVRLAQKSPGWNMRELPPQRKTLAGGCELVMLPPTLWRPRARGPLPRTNCKVAVLGNFAPRKRGTREETPIALKRGAVSQC